jgi:hypothetical protein
MVLRRVSLTFLSGSSNKSTFSNIVATTVGSMHPLDTTLNSQCRDTY